MAPGTESNHSPPQTCKQCKITKEKIERKEKLIALLKEYINTREKRGPFKVPLPPHQVNSLRSASFEDSVRLQKELSELVKCTKLDLQKHTEGRRKIDELSLSLEDKEAKLNLFEFQQKQLGAAVKEKDEKIKTLEDKIKLLTAKSESCICGSNSTPKKKRKPKDRPSDDSLSAASSVSELPPSVGSAISEFPHAGPSTGPSFVLTPASSTASSDTVPENVTSPGIAWDSDSCIGSPRPVTEPQPSSAESEVEVESQSKFCGIFQSPDKTPPAEDRCYSGSDSLVRNIFGEDSAPELVVAGETAESDDISKCDAEESKGLACDRDETSKYSSTSHSSVITADEKKAASPQMPSIFDIPLDDVQPASISASKAHSQKLNVPEPKCDPPEGDDFGSMDVSHADEESDIEDWIIPPNNDPKPAWTSLNRTEHSANTDGLDEPVRTGVLQSHDCPIEDGSIPTSSPKKVIPLTSFLESISAQSQQQPQKSSSSMFPSLSEQNAVSSPLKFSLTSSLGAVSPSKAVSQPTRRAETPSKPERLNDSDSDESHVFLSPDLRALLNPKGVKRLVSPINSQPSSPAETPAKKLAPKARKTSSVSPRSRSSSESPKKKVGTPVSPRSRRSSESPKKKLGTPVSSPRSRRSSESPTKKVGTPVSPRSRRSSASPKKKMDTPEKTPAKKTELQVLLPIKDSAYETLGLELTDDSETEEDEVLQPGMVDAQSELAKKHTSLECSEEQDHLANSPKQSCLFHEELGTFSKDCAASTSDSSEPEESSNRSAARGHLEISDQESEVGVEYDEPSSLEDELPEISAPCGVNDDSVPNGKKSPTEPAVLENVNYDLVSNEPQPSLNDSPASVEIGPTELSGNQVNDYALINGGSSPRKSSSLEIQNDKPASSGRLRSPDFCGFGSDDSSDSNRFFHWQQSGNPTTTSTTPSGVPPICLNTKPRCGILTSSALRLPTALVPSDVSPFNLTNCPSFSDLKAETVQPFSAWKSSSQWKNDQSSSGWPAPERQSLWDPIAPLCRSLQHLSIKSTSSNPFYFVDQGNGIFPLPKGSIRINHSNRGPQKSFCHNNFMAFHAPGNRCESDNCNFIVSKLVEIKEEDTPVTLYKVHKTTVVPSHNPVLNYISTAVSSNAKPEKSAATEYIDLRCQNDCQDVHCCGRRSIQWSENNSFHTGSRKFAWINNQSASLFKAESLSPSICCSGLNQQSKTSVQNPFTKWRDEQTIHKPPTKISHQKPLIRTDTQSHQRPPFNHFQQLRAPDSSQPSRLTNTNKGCLSPIQDTSPSLPSKLQASVHSGGCTPPNGPRGHAQPLEPAVSKDLKLSSPNFKNKTPKARSPKETINSGKSTAGPASQVPPKVQNHLAQSFGIKPKPATVEPVPQPLNGTTIDQVNAVNSDVPIAEKKPVKFHYTMETAMAVLKKKYRTSLSNCFGSPKKRSPCVARKSCSTVAVENPLPASEIDTSDVEFTDHDVAYSRIDKSPPKKLANTSQREISESAHSVPAEDAGSSALPSHSSSSFKVPVDYPVSQHVERSLETARLSEVLHSPSKTAFEAKFDLAVDSSSLVGPPSSDDRNVFDNQDTESIIGHHSGTYAEDAAADSSVAEMPISYESCAAEVLKNFSASSPEKNPAISVPTEQSIQEPTLIPSPVCSNGAVLSVVPSEGSTIEASVDAQTKLSWDGHHAPSNTTSLLSCQNPSLGRNLNSEVVWSVNAGCQKLIAEIPKEPADSTPVDVSIKGSLRLSPTSKDSEDCIPEINTKKKRIARPVSLSDLSSPPEPSKDRVSIRESPPKPSLPLSEGHSGLQSYQGQCSVEFKLPQSPVLPRESPLSFPSTSEADGGQPVQSDRSSRSKKGKKNKSRKKCKAPASFNAAVTFKVPAEVGVHPCPTCRYTPELCSCQVDSMVGEWRIMDPLSPFCPSPERLEADSDQTTRLSVSSECGGNSTMKDILQSQASNAPECEFTSSISQNSVEYVGLSDIPKMNETASSEFVMASVGIREHLPQDVSPTSAALGLDLSDDEAELSVVTLNRIDDFVPPDSLQPPKTIKDESLSGQIDHGNEHDTGQPEDSVSMVPSVNDESEAQSAVMDGYFRNEAVSRTVCSEEKLSNSREAPARRSRKSSSTSDTSIEDVEPAPKRRRSVRNKTAEQRVLRSRTVRVTAEKAQTPKSKPVQKRRGSRVNAKEEELCPPSAQNPKKIPKKSSEWQSRCSKNLGPHQDDAPCLPSPEEQLSLHAPKKVAELTTQRRSSFETVKRESEESSALLQSSDSDPEEKSSKRPDETPNKPMMDPTEPVAVNSAEEVPQNSQSAESPSECLDEKDNSPTGKPHLAGWITLKNTVVEEARKTKRCHSKTAKSDIQMRTPGKRKLLDIPNGPAAEAKRLEFAPSDDLSVPYIQTTPNSAEEDLLLSHNGFSESNSSHHLQDRLLNKRDSEPAGESFKNDPSVPSLLNASAPPSSLPGSEKSKFPDSLKIEPDCQPLANSYSSHQISSISIPRPYSQVNRCSSVLSHVGQFFGNRGAKLEEKTMDESPKLEEFTKDSRHTEQESSSSCVDYSNCLPSADARTDSEADSDQEMFIDYNSGSERPNSPLTGVSAPNLAPPNFGFYSQKASEDSAMEETPSSSQKVSERTNMADASTSQSSDTPHSISFYSDSQSQNFQPEPAVGALSTSRSSPIPQFSGFYSGEPTSAESNAEPVKNMVSFCTDEKTLFIPIPEDELVPCCINLMGFAQHYNLPKGYGIKTIKPFIEPNDELKSKISNQLNKYIMNSDGDLSFTYLEDFLKSREVLPSQLAKVLCEVLADSKPKSAPPKEEARGLPSYLSITQKKAVLLLVDLGKGNLAFFDKVLTVMEQFLSTNPTDQNQSFKKGNGYSNISTVYGLLCRSQGFVLRAQSFIFDLIYGRHISYFKIILNILYMVPNAMPYAGPNNGPLTYTIAYLLMMQGIYKQTKESELQNYGVTALRNKLKYKYGYSFPQDLTREHVMDELISNVMTKGCEKAIVLLCKSQGFRWAHGVAQRYIFPFLDKVVSGDETDEFKISRYVTILGEMSRGFAISIGTPFVKKSLDLLQEILKQKPSAMVTESAISALVHFRRLDLQRVLTILTEWTPPEGKISLGSIRAVKRVSAGKPHGKLEYWKSLSSVR